MDTGKNLEDSKVVDSTTMTDGFTDCCGYDFGLDGFGKVQVKYCPLCGKRIVEVLYT